LSEDSKPPDQAILITDGGALTKLSVQSLCAAAPKDNNDNITGFGCGNRFKLRQHCLANGIFAFLHIGTQIKYRQPRELSAFLGWSALPGSSFQPYIPADGAASKSGSFNQSQSAVLLL
jgi:hypothetical protein